MAEFSIEINASSNGGFVIYIGPENGSGVKYFVKSWDEVTKNIQTYIDTYVKEEVKSNG